LAFDLLIHVLGGHDPRIAGTVFFWHGELPTTQGDGVEQNTAADEPNLCHVLHTKRTQSCGTDPFVMQEAPIVEVLPLGRVDANVTRPVELRADLPQFRRHVLDVCNQFLRACRSLVTGMNRFRLVPNAGASAA
jgi:hypothetical protein